MSNEGDGVRLKVYNAWEICFTGNEKRASYYNVERFVCSQDESRPVLPTPCSHWLLAGSPEPHQRGW